MTEDERRERARESSRRYYRKNRERILAHNRERCRSYYETHRDEIKARMRAYREANLERARERTREWAANHRKELTAYRAAYARANPDRERAWRRTTQQRDREGNREREAQRRARKQEATVERVEVAVLLERNGHICGICGEELGDEFHIDHIVPLVKGGAHSYDNTQLAHPRCNLSKGGRLEEPEYA